MSSAPFLKMNGLGNEIIVADMRGRADRVTPAAAMALNADPATSFDQIMAIHDARTPGTASYIQIINSDGSLAQACGNGMRCVVQALAAETGKTDFVFETLAGILTAEEHADGTISVSSDNQAWYDLMQDLDNRRHTIVANAVWDMPDLSADGGAKRVAAAILNDWQLSGVLTAGSANHYDLSYSYQSNGSNVNLTGSPDYGARIVFNGDPGSGCSDNQYAQFNMNAVTGPSYYSNGMESGRNVLIGVPVTLAKDAA